MTHSNTPADCPPSGGVRSAGSNFPRDTQRDEPAGRSLRVLDLFSGIGGFSLGLERAGMQTVAFCEIEPYCQAVLRKHWPGVPIYSDIRTLTADALSRDGIAVDVICGGFPCQDISSSGEKAGIAGGLSGLWLEFSRLIRELRPRFVIVENVSDLLSRGIGAVLGDLASSGYDAEWHSISAAFVGLPQARERVWIIAYHHCRRGEGVAQSDSEPLKAPVCAPWHDVDGLALGQHRARDARAWMRRADHGVPSRVDRVGALGNAVVPQIPEMIGRAILAAA